MSGSARVRASAARVISAVLAGASLRTALPAARAAESSSQIQALVYGCLRQRVRIEALLEQLLSRPLKKRDRDLRSLLMLGLFELLDARTPAHAVVTETVNACAPLGLDRARGLVNAVLRRFQRERQSLLDGLEHEPHLRWSLPRWMLEQFRADWPDDWRQIAAGSAEHPPMWLRVNTLKTTVADYRAQLEQTLNAQCETHPAVSTGLRLTMPVPISKLPGFEQGLVSVQDAGAQLAAPLLEPVAGTHILDACAAPGGKTAHLAELAEGKASIVALDISEERLAQVSENTGRLGLEGVTIRAGDARQPDDWWDGVLFDRILLDVPCSATGVLRRHPDIMALRRADDIGRLAVTQAELLASMWPLLKPGGRLLYASCSVLRAENEAVTGRFLAATTDARAERLPATMPGRAAGDGWQILPGEAGMDGFHYACISKTGPD